MAEIIRDMLPETVIPAIMANWRDFIRTFQSPYIDLYDADMLWRITGTPGVGLDAVYHTNLPDNPATVDVIIAQTHQHFREQRVPLRWMVGPDSKPSWLAERLTAHGLQPVDEWVGMALNLATVAAPPLPGHNHTIELVEDDEVLREWTITGGRALEIPSAILPEMVAIRMAVGVGNPNVIRRYLTRTGETPVSTLCLLLSAGVAGIYDISTVPEARGYGIATSLILTALADAREMGYQVAVIQTSHADAGIYKKIGFDQYCTFTEYAKEE